MGSTQAKDELKEWAVPLSEGGKSAVRGAVTY